MPWLLHCLHSWCIAASTSRMGFVQTNPTRNRYKSDTRNKSTRERQSLSSKSQVSPYSLCWRDSSLSSTQTGKEWWTPANKLVQLRDRLLQTFRNLPAPRWDNALQGFASAPLSNEFVFAWRSRAMLQNQLYHLLRGHRYAITEQSKKKKSTKQVI